MKKVLKSSLSIFLAITIIFSSAYVGLAEIDFSGIKLENPFAVKSNAAESGTCGYNLRWNLEDSGILTINGTGEMTDYRYIDTPWESLSLDIKSVVINSGVTSVSFGAFSDCTNLTSVTIPDSVEIIGENAFSACTSLESIEIPDSVTSIGYGAFSACTSLTSINFPDSVTSIGSGAFSYCTSLTSIEIPDSVTSIGYRAFYNCTRLTAITISDSVTSIGRESFFNTGYYNDESNWENGVLYINNHLIAANKYDEENNEYIGNVSGNYAVKKGTRTIAGGALRNCTNLTSIEISDSVTSIGEDAFYNCTSLTSITIPDSVTSICDFAFSDCTSLTSIEIPDNVTSIGYNAFYNTGFYNDSSNWNERVLYIDNHLIKAKTSLSGEYKIKDGTKTIAGNAFFYCSKLTTVIIPDTVISIGRCAFSDCTSLTLITIPDSVTSIGEDAFYNCTSLTSVYIEDIATWCGINFEGYDANPLYYAKSLYINGELAKDIVIPDGVISICNYAFSSCTSLASITIPDSVISIGGYAFYGCTSLASITIPDSVTSIGGYAFSGCTSLASITIPDSVISIGSGALRNCKSLTSIEIPDSVTSIGEDAFYNCTSLISVTIGNGVTSIGEGAFDCCFGLESVCVDDIATWCSIDFYGKYSNPLCYAKNLYINGELVTDIVVPDGVLSISYSFYNCTSLTSVTIPDSVTSIGASAFYGCTSLASITIPDSIERIGDEAFYNCTSLTSIIIPDSVTSIGDSAFSGCTSLTSVPIPDSVTSIGYSAFFDCTSLTSVTIGNGVTRIGDYAFYGCTSLASVTIGNGVTSIGDDAFGACHNLEAVYITDLSAWCKIDFYTDGDDWGDYYSFNSNPLCCANNLYLNGELLTDIAIPDGVTSISDMTFYNCTSLTSVTIPDSVVDINNYAFAGCSNLTSIEISAGVTSIDYNAFYNCPSLTSITVDSANETFSSVDGVLFNKEKTSLEQYPSGKTNSIYVIPDGVIYIDDEAFKGCTSLTSVTIPDSIKIIGDSAFSGCHVLKYVFFNGTESDWTNLSIGSGNGDLTNSVIHYNSISHTLSDWIVDTNATCTESGSKHKECTVCGATLESETILASGHNYSTEWMIDVEPTCTEEGSKSRHCTICGDKADVTAIEAIRHTSSDWETVTKATVNSAGKKVKKCTVCGEELDTAPIKQLKCDKPTLKSIANTQYGVKITWGKVKGGDTYVVYRKTGSGSYTKIATTENTYYTDKKAKSGTKYYYYIKAENEAGTSPASSSKSILHLADPTLKSISNTEYGVKITWGKISGAEKYYIYRKTSRGSYSKVATTKNAYYTDKNAKSGKKYYYIVKAVKSSTTSASSNAKSILHLADPTLKSISNTEYGVKITWGKISGAEKYYIYRKTSGGSYSKLATTKNAYYTDKTAKSGKKYYYIVKAVKSSTTSASSSAKSILHLADPTLKTPSSTKSGVKLTWTKVTGAEGYIIYRKTGSGSYTKLKTEKGVSNLSYTDSSAKKGKKYTYKVKAYKSKTYSAYSNTKAITDKY